MGFKHNKLSSDHDDSIHFGFQHVQPLDYGGRFVSSHRHNPEKYHVSDGVRLGNNPEFEDATAFSNKDNSGNALDDASKLSSCVLNNDGETARMENSKRPFDGEENIQVASKRTKQVDGSFHSSGSTFGELATSFTLEDHFKTRTDAAVFEGAISFPWSTCSTSMENKQVSSIPYYSTPRYNWAEETQSPVFNNLPRKIVAVGPDYQADLPEWREGSDASTSSVHTITDEKSGDKWIQHCILPMPNLDFVDLEQQKIDCHCLDNGSIRCVRQHVNEAREQLRSSLGREQFDDLGLNGMGENVALEWTEEEEQLFQVVVISNSASLDKNFWDVLPRAFPARRNRELVSYYFNVFMLRKRVEQNRSDPLHVDSDDDEWQEMDDGEFEENEDEEDDDSGVESPIDVSPLNRNNGNNEVDIHEEGEGDDYEEDGHSGVGKPKFEDHDVHNDSCTSYEEQHHNGADSSGGMTDHDFAVGHCEPKPWDIGYIQGFEKDLDLLPTCNVIEEVFGNDEHCEK